MKINSNLDDLKSKLFILDSLVQDGNIFVSGFQFSEQDGKNCKKFRLYDYNVVFLALFFLHPPYYQSVSRMVAVFVH